MKINLKITGLLFLLLLSVFILYLSFEVKDRQTLKIKGIEITGGKYFSNDGYASFAMLKDTSYFSYLNPAIIKDRIERHPYVDKAEVRFDGTDKILVRIQEKKFAAMLVDSTKQVLVTDNMQVIPCLPNSAELNFPVISNIKDVETFKNFSFVNGNSEVKTAFKILEVFKLTNSELADNLSQIDLRNGKDILVYFSNLNFPVVFGRNDEIKKAVYFNSLWKFMKGNEINNYLDYVDLRFDKHVFLGVTENNTGNEGKQI